MTPPRASTSRTKCPLPIPPIDGLQDSSPKVDKFWVRRAVFAPVLAAAVHASLPACPPPITITSYVSADMDMEDASRDICVDLITARLLDFVIELHASLPACP